MNVRNDEQKRTEIAVSIAAPNKIVALATGAANGGSGLYGIYISYDKGESWTFRCCGPQPAGVPSANNINMMGWQPSGLDDGGQYYYDLALAVNPFDANIIHDVFRGLKGRVYNPYTNLDVDEGGESDLSL